MSKFLSMRKGEVKNVDTKLADQLIEDGMAEEYILVNPEGKINITHNGEDIDVSLYAKADVNVVPEGTIKITKNGWQDVAQYGSANVYVINNTVLKTKLRFSGSMPAVGNVVGFSGDDGSWGMMNIAFQTPKTPYTPNGIEGALFLVDFIQDLPETVTISASCPGKTIYAVCAKFSSAWLAICLKSSDTFIDTDEITVTISGS